MAAGERLEKNVIRRRALQSALQSVVTARHKLDDAYAELASVVGEMVQEESTDA